MSSIFTDGVTPLNKVTLDQLELKASKGVASGHASLDSGGKVPVAQLPVVSVSGTSSGARRLRGLARCSATARSTTATNATYLALWNAIGTTYGGTGQSSFAVPDLRGRVPVGVSASGPTIINARGKNEGVAATLRSPNHHHTYNAGSTQPWSGNIGNTVPTPGSGNTSGDANNTDTPAFIALNAFVLL
jgi:microcystin-dependent protein